MKEALGCTVPYDRVVLSEELYLTNEEISCIQNIMIKADKECSEKRECISLLCKVCAKPKYPTNYLRMYEYIMAAVSSYLGDCEKYDESDKIKKELIKLLLINRRIRGIHEALYGLLWNEEKSPYKRLSDRKEKIEKCIIISELCNDYGRKKIYQEKL